MKPLAMLLLLLTAPVVFVAGPAAPPARGCELLKRLLHHRHICPDCGGCTCHRRKCPRPPCHCGHGLFPWGRRDVYGYPPPFYGPGHAPGYPSYGPGYGTGHAPAYVEPAPPAYEEIAPPGRTF